MFYSVFKSSSFVIWDRKLELVAIGNPSACLCRRTTRKGVFLRRSFSVDVSIQNSLMQRAGREKEERKRQGEREREIKGERDFLWTCGNKSPLTGNMKTGGGVFLFKKH